MAMLRPSPRARLSATFRASVSRRALRAPRAAALRCPCILGQWTELALGIDEQALVAALHDELGSAFNLLLPHPDAEGHVVLTQSMRRHSRSTSIGWARAAASE